MRVKDTVNMKKSYKVREAPVFLVFRILFLQMLVFLTIFILGLFDFSFLIFVPVYVLNTLFLAYVIASWYKHIYVITPKAIYKTQGVFFQRNENYDLKSFREVKLKQGIIELLFNYGTIEMTSPVLSHSVLLSRIRSPRRNLEIIEKHRLKEVTDASAETVVPLA